MRQDDRSADEVIAGVPPGGIRDPYIVKIMICFLCRELGAPVTEQELIECLEEHTVNYFLLTTTIAEMKRLGHLREQGKGLVLTPLGERTASQLSDQLPVTLRERVLSDAGEARRQERIASETSASVTQTENGYQVGFSFHDGELEFMSLSLFAPDAEQAHKLKVRLESEYQQLYIDLITRLTADPQPRFATKSGKEE